MAEMITCKICGRLFEAYLNNNVCGVCKVKDDEIYTRLREYLIQHPRSKIFEVSAELDIPIFYIKRYLREDRLEIVEKNNLFLKCDNCGDPIRSGFYCEKCASASNNNEKATYASTTSYPKRNESEDERSNGSIQKITYVKNNINRSRRFSI